MSPPCTTPTKTIAEAEAAKFNLNYITRPYVGNMVNGGLAMATMDLIKQPAFR
jgi:succinyl-CoA synthetase beta subunit